MRNLTLAELVIIKKENWLTMLIDNKESINNILFFMYYTFQSELLWNHAINQGRNIKSQLNFDKECRKSCCLKKW